ncbi:Gfo/Idh/MocA family oxidoreductase [bacterium]|nr:MAG: Gfo/Idh/MocA family oxidoreductase [bacterium]
MIETAILGTGYGISTYAKAIAVHPLFDLHTIFSRDESKAKQARKDLGFRKHTNNLTEILSDRKIRLVCVATPPHTHYEFAKKALLAGKHVICSAPFMMSIKEAEELAELAKKQDLLAVVDHHVNYYPARKYAQRLLADGKIGKLTHIERIYRDNQMFNTDALSLWKMQRKLKGGALGILGSHDIDYLLRIAGGIRSVSAKTFTSHPQRESTDGQLIENDADDSFQLAIGFHSGVKAQIHVTRSYVGKTQDEFIFHGHKGSLHFTNNTDLIYYEIGSEKRERLALPPAYQLANIPGSYQTAAFYMLLEILSSAIFHQTPVSPTFDEGIHIQRVLDASYLSASSGNTIIIGEDESAPVKPVVDEIVVKKIYD